MKIPGQFSVEINSNPMLRLKDGLPSGEPPLTRFARGRGRYRSSADGCHEAFR
jgi:hypothetical protein